MYKQALPSSGLLDALPPTEPTGEGLVLLHQYKSTPPLTRRQEIFFILNPTIERPCSNN